MAKNMFTGLSSLNAWTVKTKAEKARIKNKAQTYVRNSVKRVVNEVAKVSPQFSGNYLINWRLYLTSSPAVTYNPALKWDDWKAVPSNLRRGQNQNPARSMMLQANYATLANIKYNSKIMLWNPTYAADVIEEGQIEFRDPENTAYQLHGDGMIPHLQYKFSYLRKAR
jgi:hypothetical protein